MVPEEHRKPGVTALLRAWKNGEKNVSGELLPLIYDELRRRAAAYLRRERPGHTLQPTALVHEAYLKLLGQRNGDWNDRQHFFAVASQIMRRILVDHARNRHRRKRGGPAEELPLDEAMLAASDAANIDLIALDEALARLARLDPRQEKLVELRYFGGLSLEKAAETLNISRATAARDWQIAKAWLHRELTRKT